MAGLLQRLVRPNESSRAVGDAEYGPSSGKPGAGIPVLDDHPFADRGPALDPIILVDDDDRAVFDLHLAAGGPQRLRDGSRPVRADLVIASRYRRPSHLLQLSTPFFPFLAIEKVNSGAVIHFHSRKH